ncbi:DNA (cytosine-5-)-methyltransferase [Bacillus mycoides]|uniref:DNA cytosine methyltransferase n=1 Tax=Bacillus mycoides TaxID=1405 RepID=UPI002DFEFF91|nr:DNA (cytosine-5-)-methyltransferase [Bacillus mycoides]MEC5238942.1 DNA (cytosine-5-)-methyltransferase [Bacillus mycoides]MEC5262848.1 DNA (cytosine-5-)-methyltransferase [Bacillus mycoides]
MMENSQFNKNQPLRIATTFSGIGAAEFALKRLNISHEIVFACDNAEIELNEEEKNIRQSLAQITDYQEKKKYIDSLIPKRKTNFVKQTYMANYEIDENHFHHDVRFLDGNQYKNQVDLFVGGSPCQSFTLFGYQKGLDEARGTLFYEFARLIKEIQPKVFIYENVQGLVKHDKGKTWNVVQRVFDSLGYKVHYQILNSADYGIPQKRRRIFIVGFKDSSIEYDFPLPKELKYTMQDFLVENTAEGNFIANGEEIHINKTPGVVEDRFYLSEKVLPGIMSHGTNGFNMKPEIDLPIARPLMSTMHKLHRAGVDNYVTTNGRIRRLTPRECLRLMGFTDEFKHVVSNTQMYRQAGNSVVVDVLMELIKEIIEVSQRGKLQYEMVSGHTQVY